MAEEDIGKLVHSNGSLVYAPISLYYTWEWQLVYYETPPPEESAAASEEEQIPTPSTTYQNK